MTALLVLGVYKTLLERLGLRRLVVLSFCCSALAVLYSITACKSLLPRRQLDLYFPLATLSLTSLHNLVWLHQVWTTQAALLSFLFDLVGGGDMVRITIVCTCIADVSPPEKL